MSSHHHSMTCGIPELPKEREFHDCNSTVYLLLSVVDAVFAGRRAFFTKVIYLKIKDGRRDEKVGRPSGVK